MPCVRIHYTDERGYLRSIRRSRTGYVAEMLRLVARGCTIRYAVAVV